MAIMGKKDVSLYSGGKGEKHSIGLWSIALVDSASGHQKSK
jgi:hypothetical protein